MKRYLVFSGHDYYPGGGAGDFVAGFDNLEDAKEKCKNIQEDWSHIFDTKELKIIDNYCYGT